METKIVIARHGNTFNKGDVVLRVGSRTDLPLSTSGIQQAKNLGVFLQAEQLIPDLVFCSNLQRTIQTADKIIKTMGLNVKIQQDDIFNEIDYGTDDGKPEEQVMKRLGEQALRDWEEKFIVPDGWQVSCVKMQQNWLSFAEKILTCYQGNTVLVVTSGGVAKFASFLSESLEYFKQKYTFKLSTGSASLLVNNDKDDFWQVKFWNKHNFPQFPYNSSHLT
jgi:probable phosphoglycerate mutase